MSKRKKRVAGRSGTPRPEPSKTLRERIAPFLDSPWAPVVFFLLLSVAYFAGFVFTDHVILGQDTGTDFHKGREPFLQKLADLAPANWTRYLGGTPVTGQRTSQYFPLEIIALFTTRHRLLGWRYVFAMFMAGYFMYLCIRGLGLKPLTAWLTGIAYASAPTLLTFIYAGHEAKMLVIGLFPLMVWGLYRGLETGRLIYYLVAGSRPSARAFTRPTSRCSTTPSAAWVSCSPQGSSTSSIARETSRPPSTEASSAPARCAWAWASALWACSLNTGIRRPNPGGR